HHDSNKEGEGGHRKHRRRHEASDGHEPGPPPSDRHPNAEPGQWPPFEDSWHGARPSAPPSGWHGSSGAPPPPGWPPPGPPGPGPPPFGAPPGPPPGWGPPPDVRYEVAHHDDPYGSPFGAVPPPPSLDASRGKGKKGKGKGKESPEEGGEVPRGASLPDGLIVSQIPPEVNSLDSLNRHFRQFGEVLKITSHLDEGKAFIQFATREAAEAATVVAVLNDPNIAMA
ncbi:unnamed protein product, partial [Polarella glacialis]